MITLTLNNIGRARHLRWQEYCLKTTGAENDVYVATVFETDQIQFRLDCPANTVGAKILIGGAELRGAPTPPTDSKDVASFNFMPKSNNRFGYEAFFLHYCGIAQISAVVTDNEGREERVLFESINVCGRKITSERVVNILEYLSSNITKTLLEALSPTQFKASLVNDGVSAADRLQLLENTISEIDVAVRSIIAYPLNSLRPSDSIIHNPMPEDLESNDLEWIVENSGQSVEAGSPDAALFHYGLQWRTLHELQSTRAASSTDIEENRVIWYHLNTLRRAASEILHECSASDNASSPQIYEQDGEVYSNFYSIANRMLNRLGESYHHRATDCLNKVVALTRVFEAAVPTSKVRPSSLRPTLKMQANNNYMRIMRAMHSWLENREVVWIEKQLFSSINSTWKLFEYYMVVNTHNQLCDHGNDDESHGLFAGQVNGVPVRLLYEPTIYTTDKSKPGDQYVIVDQYTRNYRTPDIVIEIGAGDELELLVMDAKCRSERDVWPDLQKCELKYTGAIRNKRTGQPIVKALIMLYPMTTDHSHSHFQDYYTGPYKLNGALQAWPAMGLQRIPISSEGEAVGYENLLSTLLDKTIGQAETTRASVVELRVG